MRKSAGAAPRWAGGGSATDLALHAAVLKQDLELGKIQFLVPGAKPAKPSKKVARKAVSADIASDGALRVDLIPFAIPLGAASPATASGSFDTEHYSLHVSGDAELARLMRVAQALGVGTPGVGLAGAAQMDVNVAGSWTGFAPPSPSGKLQLRTVTAELQGVSEPLMIDTANISLENQSATVNSFKASFSKGTPVSGTANFPIHCTAPENCLVRFDVRTDDISLARINQLFNPSFSKHPWYHLLELGRWHEDALSKVRASGHFAVSHFAAGLLTASNLDGTLELSSGKLRIGKLQADMLGGRQDSSWIGDFTVSPPRFMGNGVVSKVSMAQVGTLMHDNWATGNVDAQYSIALSGLNASTLRDSASGSADFTWSGGALRHVVLEGRGTPMAFTTFNGKIALQSGTFTITDGKMRANGVSYGVKGTASYNRSVAMRLERTGGPSYVISGTLDQPKVETIATPAAEAALR